MRDDKLQEIIELLPYSIRYSGEIEELLDYAKEQAERVQELEDKLARIRFVNNDYDKQNKRYREALVKLRNDIGKIKTGYEKNVFVIKTVDDALIDWEALEG